MKITDVKVTVWEWNDIPPTRYTLNVKSSGTRSTHMALVKIITDEGIVGLGERIAGSAYSAHLKDIKSHVRLLEEFVGQFVIGQNPLNIELIWDRMYGLSLIHI